MNFTLHIMIMLLEIYIALKEPYLYLMNILYNLIMLLKLYAIINNELLYLLQINVF